MMKIANLEQLISAFIDGEIPEPKRPAIARLIATNREAAAIHRDFLRLREMIAATPRVEAPAELSQSIMDRIGTLPKLKKESRVVVYHLKNRRLWIWAGTIGTASVLFVLTCVNFWNGLTVSGPKSEAEVARQIVQPEIAIPSAVSPKIPGAASGTVAVPVAAPAEKQRFTPAAPLASRGESATIPETPSLVSLCWVRCELNSNIEAHFSDRFLQQCNEMNLVVKKSVRNGRESYEFNLNRDELARLISWFQSRTDWVQQVNVSPLLKKWQNAQAETEPLLIDVPQSETLSIRFEFSL